MAIHSRFFSPAPGMTGPQDLYTGPRLEGSAFGPPEEETEEILSGVDARIGAGANMLAMFIGVRGEGKTALMNALMKRQQEVYIKRRFPGRLFANYEVKFFRRAADGRMIDYWSPWLLDEIAMFPPYLSRGLMGIDEVQGGALGRRSMAGANVNLSFFLTQIRHRDIEALFTTQFPQLIDYQVLIQTNLFIRVRTLARHRSGFPARIRCQIFDYWGTFTGKDHRKRWPPQPEDVDAVRDFYLAPWLAGSYDTKEIITSQYWNQSVRERVIQSEHARHGGDREFLEEMRPQVLEANAARRESADQVSRARTLETLIEDLPRNRIVNLRPYIEQARKITGGKVGTGVSLMNAINEADLGFRSWKHVSPSGAPVYIAEYKPKGKME